jgi:hypothetical protein
MGRILFFSVLCIGHMEDAEGPTLNELLLDIDRFLVDSRLGEGITTACLSYYIVLIFFSICDGISEDYIEC